jgi:hypothetical protein
MSVTVVISYKQVTQFPLNDTNLIHTTLFVILLLTYDGIKGSFPNVIRITRYVLYKVTVKHSHKRPGEFLEVADFKTIGT